MSTARPFRHRLAVLAVAPLALALVACGSDDDADDTAGSPSETVTVTESPEADTSPTDTPSEDTGGDTGGGSGGGSAGDAGAISAAAETALGELPGATLVTIDRDDDGDWDVTLLTDDGVENDVDVSADGSTVTRGPDADDDDADDRAERRRLLDAQVDWAAAIETARGEISDLDVTGAELDEDDGVLRWDVDLGDDADDDQRTVLVDAASGDVIGTDRDDNDDD